MTIHQRNSKDLWFVQLKKKWCKNGINPVDLQGEETKLHQVSQQCFYDQFVPFF